MSIYINNNNIEIHQYANRSSLSTGNKSNVLSFIGLSFVILYFLRLFIKRISVMKKKVPKTLKEKRVLSEYIHSLLPHSSYMSVICSLIA